MPVIPRRAGPLALGLTITGLLTNACRPTLETRDETRSASGTSDAVNGPSSAAPPSAAPSTATSARAAGSPTVDLMPQPALASGALITRLMKYPEPLEARDITLPLRGSEPFITGKILWAKEYRAKNGFVAVQLYVCEPGCEATLLKQLKATAAVGLLVQTQSAKLPGARLLEVNLAGMGLGGAATFTSSASPHGQFQVLAMIDLPPHDIPVSERAREFYRSVVPLELGAALGTGLDAAFFP